MCEIERWQSARLTFTGDGVKADQIESLLKIKPTYSAKAGETFESGGRVYMNPTNEWTWEYPDDASKPFPERVSFMLSTLEKKADDLKEVLSAPGVRGEFSVMCSPGYDEDVAKLFPAALDRISALGLELSLDLYKTFDSEEDE